MPPVPLNPLRVFLASSRHASFVEAAETLHVTPGAISRQVKALEDFLGIRLYTQGANRKELTEAGRQYARVVGPPLDEVEQQTARFISSHSANSLRLSCSNHFMRQWLLARLVDFLERFPRFDLSFDVSRPADPVDRTADVSIRYGLGDWPGMECEQILKPALTPICSPGYLRAHPALERPEDLAGHTLLLSGFRPDDWSDWFAASGLGVPTTARCVTFAGTYLAYQAAIMDGGIALGRSGMIDRDLASGALVAPFPIWAEVDAGFHLCVAKGATDKKAVAAFRKWIMAQIAAGPRAGPPPGST